MKTRILQAAAATTLGLMLTSNTQADTRTWDFDDWFGPAVTNLTLASTSGSPEYQGWNGGNPNGFLQLTKGAAGQNLAVVFPDIDNGAPVKAFTFRADLRVGNGTVTPADGFSISYVRENDPALINATTQVVYPGAGWPYDPTIYRLGGYAGGDSAAQTTDPAGSTNPESGSKTGVSISFDAWAGNWLPDTGAGGVPGPDRVGVFVRVDDKTLISRALTEANQDCSNTNSMQTGTNDASNLPDILNWCRLEVQKTTDNKLTVIWKGAKILDNYQIPSYSVHRGRIILAGRTGGSWQNVNFDNVYLETVPAIEATFEGLVVNPDLKGWSFTLKDTGASAVTNISQVIWNGLDVTAAVTSSKTGDTTTGVYTQAGRLPPGSANQVTVTYKTALNQTLTGVGNAATPGYFVMPVADVLPLSAVAGQPRGMVLGPTWQTTAGNPNTITWTEEQILGLHGANLITGTWPTSTDILDYQNDGPAGQANGNFRVNGSTAVPPFWDGADYTVRDLGFGSNPTYTITDNAAIEWFTYVNFPAAGDYYVIFNSDDGFQLSTARHAKDRMGSVISSYIGGRGNGTGLDAGTRQRVIVDAPGVYPIRGLMQNGGGGFNLEWYTRVDTNLYLVNNSSTPQSLQAWQTATGVGCYVQSAIPVRDATGVSGNQKIMIDLGEGSTTVNVGSVVLKVDGVVVAPTRTGLHWELAPVGPGGLWVSNSRHTNTLTFTDSASTAYSYTWSFTVAPYVVLPVGLASAPGTGTDPGVRIQMWHKSPLPASPNPENIVNGWRNMLVLGNQVAEGFYPTNAADMSTFTHAGQAWDSEMINYAQTSAGALADNGNFRQPAYPDKVFPGIPGIGMPNADNDAGVFRTFVEFPAAGYYTLGVNSDDGFRLTVGDSMGPAKTPVKVLKPASLFGDKVALHCQNGLEGVTFGGPLPASPGIIAQAVEADPILADTALNNAAAMQGKIAIVRRGVNSFFVKALNCKAAGAIAVVMANNNSDAPGAFGGADSTLNDFPCITMNQTDGDALIAAATTGTDSPVWLRLGDDDSLRCGQADGGKGSSDVTFGVYVPAAGLYPMRLLWMNGGGDLNCELFWVDVNGGKHLLNDPATTIKLWINRQVPAAGTMNQPVLVGGSYVSISWAGAGELQMALDVNGPWFKASWQTSPAVMPIMPALAPMYFRLRSY